MASVLDEWPWPKSACRSFAGEPTLLAAIGAAEKEPARRCEVCDGSRALSTAWSTTSVSCTRPVSGSKGPA
eukprot:6201900-Pleurochrysis_carterae.AAC.2